MYRKVLFNQGNQTPDFIGFNFILVRDFPDDNAQDFVRGVDFVQDQQGVLVKVGNGCFTSMKSEGYFGD